MEANKFAFGRKMPVGVAYSVDLPAMPAPPEQVVKILEWDFLIEEQIKIEGVNCSRELN